MIKIKFSLCHERGINWKSSLFTGKKYKTDLEPPKIANCPDDIHKTSEKKWTQIFLPGVIVTDNVGVYLFTTSRLNGSKFTWGEHNVTYTASDKARNTAKCHFQVIIVGMYSLFV